MKLIHTLGMMMSMLVTFMVMSQNSPSHAQHSEKRSATAPYKSESETNPNTQAVTGPFGYKILIPEMMMNQISTGDKAMERAEELSEQIMNLKLFIREARNRSAHRGSGGVFQKKALVSFGREAAGPVRNDVQYVSDQQTTDPSFLTASAAVSPGKPGPGKVSTPEPEAKATTSDLKKRMEDIVWHIKTLQQMIDVASQKAGKIKRLERQAYSKLADLEELKKSWEGRKIPINEEFIAIEKKLNADLIMYRESLKEVEAFKQQLVSMPN